MFGIWRLQESLGLERHMEEANRMKRGGQPAAQPVELHWKNVAGFSKIVVAGG